MRTFVICDFTCNAHCFCTSLQQLYKVDNEKKYSIIDLLQRGLQDRDGLAFFSKALAEMRA
jgi:hypothetical protein